MHIILVIDILYYKYYIYLKYGYLHFLTRNPATGAGKYHSQSNPFCTHAPVPYIYRLYIIQIMRICVKYSDSNIKYSAIPLSPDFEGFNGKTTPKVKLFSI
jgi:hypothetical protein